MHCMDGLLRMARRELRQMIKIVKIWSGVGQIVEVVESVSRMGEDSCLIPNSTNKQMDKRLVSR